MLKQTSESSNLRLSKYHGPIYYTCVQKKKMQCTVCYCTLNEVEMLSSLWAWQKTCILSFWRTFTWQHFKSISMYVGGKKHQWRFKNKNNLDSFSSDFIDHKSSITIKEHANSNSIIFSKFLNFAQQWSIHLWLTDETFHELRSKKKKKKNIMPSHSLMYSKYNLNLWSTNKSLIR